MGSNSWSSKTRYISEKKHIASLFFCVPIQFYNYLASEFPLGAPLVPKSSKFSWITITLTSGLAVSFTFVVHLLWNLAQNISDHLDSRI